MRTSTNIGLQASAFVLALAICLATPGWSLLIFVFTVVGVLVPLTPLIVAVAIKRRDRICPAVQVPFLAAAVLLVLAAAFRREGDMRSKFVPAVRLFAPGAEPSRAVEEAFWTVGTCALVGFLGALLWILIAISVTAVRSDAARPAMPPRL